MFHVKQPVRFIDKRAAELGYYAQNDLDSVATNLAMTIRSMPSKLAADDPRLELLGRIIYDSRKIDQYTSGARRLWE